MQFRGPNRAFINEIGFFETKRLPDKKDRFGDKIRSRVRKRTEFSYRGKFNITFFKNLFHMIQKVKTLFKVL